MEEMLGRFQGDLGNISSEIRSLQEQSQSMSVCLRNRKDAETRLGAFLEGLAIPPALVEGILHCEPDAGFQACPWWLFYELSRKWPTAAAFYMCDLMTFLQVLHIGVVEAAT